MKKLLSLILFSFWGIWLNGQNLSAEYFFGADPGVGNGTSLSATALGNNEFEISANLNTAGLEGIHTLSIRTYKDGLQGITYTKTLAITNSTNGSTSCEYFFDQDPGVGNGIALSSTSLGNGIFEVSGALNNQGLTGIHTLYIRSFNGANVGFTYAKQVVIIDNQNAPLQVEYFFDKDPGIGNGIKANTTDLGNNIFAFQDNLSTGGLAGIHDLYIRGLNNNNVGFTYVKPVVIIDSTVQNLSIEYFFDEDPGLGMGQLASLSPLGNGVYSFQGNLAVGNMRGLHQLYLRAIDNNLQGFTYSQPVVIVDTTTQPLSLEYFFDQDPGFGNGNQTALTHLGGGVYSLNNPISSTGISGGLHTLYMRATASRAIGQTYAKPIYVKAETDSVITLSYYFDHPPTTGSPSTITLQEISDNIFEFDQTLSTIGLTPGIHQLFIQPIKPAKGFMQQFPVFIVDDADITETEYFIDTDPGFGNGIPLSHLANNRVVILDQLSLTGRTPGKIKLGLRSKASSGVWGITQWDSLCISPQPNFIADTVCLGDTTSFVNISGNPNDSTQYFWDLIQSGNFTLNMDSGFNHLFTTAGTHVISLAAVQPDGCTDTLTKTILVNPIDTTILFDTICDGDAVLGHTATGIYFDTFAGSNTCDSVVNLFLEVLQHSDSIFTVDTCDRFVWLGDTITQSGTYLDTILNAAGCDSLMTLNLSIRSTSMSSVSDTACDFYVWNGDSLFTSGIYFDTIPNAASCDSLMTLNLTIFPTFLTQIEDTICGNEVYITAGGQLVSSSGVYYDTLSSVFSCDSIVETYLTVNPTFFTQQIDSICPGEVYTTPGGQQVTNSGVFNDTLQSYNGCDSVVETTISLRNLIEITESDQICQGEVWITFGGYSLFSDTVLIDTSYNGYPGECDLRITSSLTVLPLNSIHDTATICENESYISYTGTALSTAGIHLDTIYSSSSCDTVVFTYLTINSTYLTSDSVSICSNQPYTTPGGQILSNPGVYFDTLQSTLSCDSIIETILSVIPTSDSLLTITTCESFFWQGETFYQSGVYYDTIPNAAGCDSLMILNLTIHNATSSTSADTACEVYVWNGQPYTTSGTYFDTISNSKGCDSAMTLNLTIHTASTSSASDTACGVYVWNGQPYTTSGTYFDTIPNSKGCDSLMTLNLTIRNATAETFTADVCGNYTWQGMNLSQSGTYFDTIPNSKGCDSLMTLNLTIRNATSETFTADVCGSYTWQGMNLSQSGTYFDTIPNSQGCDSLMTLDLTIYNATSSTITDTACGSYVWMGNSFSQSGTYFDTIPNNNGCGSLMTLNLTIYNATSSTTVDTACGSYVWLGNSFSQSGTYYDTIPNSAGCDSLMTLNLTIQNASTSIVSDTACEFYLWNGDSLFTSGTYFDTLSNAAGCDSVVTLNLTVSKSFFNFKTDTACNWYIWNGDSLNQTGLYIDSLTSSLGCDSVEMLHLTIHKTTFQTFNEAACESYFWLGDSIFQSGTYIDTLPNHKGCDSIVTLNLTINQPSVGFDVIEACESYTWIDGNTYTSSTNTPTYTIANAKGCDSLVYLNLTIHTIDVSIDSIYDYIIGLGYTVILNAVPGQESYHWVYCDDFSSVSDTGNTPPFALFASSFKEYAVIITNGACIDTSNCYMGGGISGIKDTKYDHKISIIPNPNNGQFQLSLIGEVNHAIQVEVLSISGALIQQEIWLPKNQTYFTINADLAQGTYLLKLTSEHGVVVKRFLVR